MNTDSLRALNSEAYNVAAAIQAHVAFRCLPAGYRDAVAALFDATQEIHDEGTDHLLDFGDPDGEGGIDGRAWDIQEGDVVLEDGGGDPFYVTALNGHGDAVLITAEYGFGQSERTLDGDDGVTYWRED